jgi:hypothetical protein
MDTKTDNVLEEDDAIELEMHSESELEEESMFD